MTSLSSVLCAMVVTASVVVPGVVLADAPTAPATPTPSRRSPAARSEARSVITQLLLGGALGTAGMYAGGAAVIELSGGRYEVEDFGAVLLAGAVGVTIGTTAGVMLGGSDREHDASLPLTYLGSLGGGALAAAVAFRYDSLYAVMASVVAGSTIGGVVTHRLTRRRNASIVDTRIVPMLGAHGVGISLVGRLP